MKFQIISLLDPQELNTIFQYFQLSVLQNLKRKITLSKTSNILIFLSFSFLIIPNIETGVSLSLLCLIKVGLLLFTTGETELNYYHQKLNV